MSDFLLRKRKGHEKQGHIEGEKQAPAALRALRRAAKKAIELGRLTGTPAYVLRNGQIVDAAKRTRKTRKMHAQAK